MYPQKSSIPIDRHKSDSGVSELLTPDHNGSAPPVSKSAANLTSDDLNELLRIDLKQHRGNVEKLFAICKDLQVLGIEQSLEISRLQAETANLTKSLSKRSSRRETDDSEFSQKVAVDTRQGIAVVFSPSDNALTVRQMRGMKGRRLSQLPQSVLIIIQTRTTSGPICQPSIPGQILYTSTTKKGTIRNTPHTASLEFSYRRRR